jgi:hypothetical protein
MFRYRSSQILVIVALCSTVVAATWLLPRAFAAPGDVVDLEAKTHRDPPSPTTENTADKAPLPDNATRRNNERASQKEAAAKLKLRAGEKVGDDAQGQSQVLGMSLQEGEHGRVKVVEVSVNSPAFDAGVMKGDEILSYQGFRGESYRKWIDGMRQLTTDTVAGLMIPVVVARDGKQVTVRIRIPEKPVHPSTPQTLAQPGNPLISSQVGPALPAPGGPIAVATAGGNNVAIENSGPFGEFFGGATASPNERAMAQIVRLGGQPTTHPSTTGATAAPILGGARIGLAGFHDDPAGMVVMVDVGALPPGNYTVGISDPSVIGGAAVIGTGAVRPNVQTPSVTPGSAGINPPQNNSNTAVGTSGQSTTADGNDPGAAAAGITIPPTGQTRPLTTPPTGQVRPLTAPPTGQVNPSSTTPTGQSSVNNAQRAQMARDAAGAGQNVASSTGGPGASGATLNHIGTITIDQSGTGRMRQTVESVQVRNVVGQAIVIYSPGGSPQRTLPANLNGSAGAATRQGVTDSGSARSSQAVVDATSGPDSAAPQTAVSGQTAAGSQVPVAAGIIQLITDRRPPPATDTGAAETPTGTKTGVKQPASATPPAGQNLVR